MNTPLLKIGDTDVSGYITQGSMTVSEQAVFDSETFTNVYGETFRTQTGISVKISVKLELVPADLAESIMNECDEESLNVTYTYPAERSAQFERPDISTTYIFEDDTGLYYDISLNLNCPFIALDSL